ncbi:Hypothetical predicted protein [Pelobates cultripes]|uniref:Uncharacterized protein n=1 Tax=Pelobates cultripes TaxID=61616 RepID=A0AAD1S0M6_PELCU|nr:Hypothetical predicted protein [Pelobates cultripes]
MELRSLLSLKAHRAVQLTRGSFYAQGNKSGKLLARALKTKLQKSFITHIKNSQGKQCNTTDDIADAFSEFYHNLYNLTPPEGTPLDLHDYLRANILHRVRQKQPR